MEHWKREAPPANGRGSERQFNDQSKPFPKVAVSQTEVQGDRLTADVVAELRAMWWRLRRQGVGLPVQPGVILIEGWRYD